MGTGDVLPHYAVLPFRSLGKMDPHPDPPIFQCLRCSSRCNIGGIHGPLKGRSGSFCRNIIAVGLLGGLASQGSKKAG